MIACNYVPQQMFLATDSDKLQLSFFFLQQVVNLCKSVKFNPNSKTEKEFISFGTTTIPA